MGPQSQREALTKASVEMASLYAECVEVYTGKLGMSDKLLRC